MTLWQRMKRGIARFFEEEGQMEWDPVAEKELEKLPMYLRNMARKAVEDMGTQKGVTRITMVEISEAKAKYLGGKV